MSMDELVALLNAGRDDLRVRHLPGLAARAAAHVRRGLPSAFVDVMLRDCVGDPEAAVAAFGLRLTSLRDTWS
jgi:hypothetical protein